MVGVIIGNVVSLAVVLQICFARIRAIFGKELLRQLCSKEEIKLTQTPESETWSARGCSRWVFEGVNCLLVWC